MKKLNLTNKDLVICLIGLTGSNLLLAAMYDLDWKCAIAPTIHQVTVIIILKIFSLINDKQKLNNDR